MTKNELNTYMARLYRMSDGAIEKMNGQVDNIMIKAYKNSLKNVQSKLAGMYEKYGDNVKLSDMHKFDRLLKMENNIKGQIVDLGKDLKKITTGSIKDNFSEAYYHSGYIMETPLDINMGFTGLNPDVIRSAVVNPYDAIKWPESMGNNLSILNDQIRRTVTEGLVQGQGYAKTARAFRDKFEMSVYRANRIVRTESHRAKSMGRNLAFDQSVEAGETLGMEVGHFWDPTNDSRTRPKHRAMAGKKAKLVDGEYWWTFPDGVRTRGPGLSGVAEHDIHERCDTYTAIEDVTDDFEDGYMKGKAISETSYNDWAKANSIKTKINLPGTKALRRAA